MHYVNLIIHSYLYLADRRLYSGELPTEVDWRKAGVITDAKNQVQETDLRQLIDRKICLMVFSILLYNINT